MSSIDGSKRSTCWSITINNPTEEDHAATQNVVGWKDFIEFKGQVEKGEEGTEHIQGMLITKSTKFSAVKKHFPRAHIEIAKNKVALSKYVEKEETRVAELQGAKVATVVNLNTMIVPLFQTHNLTKDKENVEDMIEVWEKEFNIGDDDRAGMLLLDMCVEDLINADYYGIEYIGANPSIRATWKKYWKAMVRREFRKET